MKTASRSWASAARLALALILGAGGSLAGQEPAKPGQPVKPAKPPVVEPSPALAQQGVSMDLEWEEPPGDQWVTDENGLKYVIARLRKVPGTWGWLDQDQKQIHYKRLYRLTVDREDEKFLYIRYYQPPDPAEEAARAAEIARAEEARLARVQESYRVEERSVDRLTFADWDRGLPREGQWRQGLEVADVNGDGFLDIVHGPPRKETTSPVVFLGDGAGGWRTWTEVSWPPVPYDYGDVAVGDVDGDGRLDLGLGIHLRGVTVLLQEAPGRFVEAAEGLPFDLPGRGGDASGFASRAVEFVDWNDDGKLDLVALGEGPRQTRTHDGKTEGVPVTMTYGLVVFLNQGDRTWKALSPGTAGGVFGDSFAVGRWNADQHVDVATVSYVHGNRDVIHLNDDDALEGWVASELSSLRPQAWTFGITAGDFDEDGRDDLVTSFATHDGDLARRGLERSWRDATGAWQTRLITAWEGEDNAWALASGDVDGDRHRDLVVSTERGNVLVLLGDGSGGFARETSPELDPPAPCRGYGLRLADLDQDGRAEIVAGFAGESEELLVFLGEAKCRNGGAVRVWRPAQRPVS